MAATAKGDMDAFPDLLVSLDHLHVAGGSVFRVWTLTGTSTAPDGRSRRWLSQLPSRH
jgi:hypothetical protein